MGSRMNTIIAVPNAFDFQQPSRTPSLISHEDLLEGMLGCLHCLRGPNETPTPMSICYVLTTWVERPSPERMLGGPIIPKPTCSKAPRDKLVST
jgi:hypothetical protein